MPREQGRRGGGAGWRLRAFRLQVRGHHGYREAQSDRLEARSEGAHGVEERGGHAEHLGVLHEAREDLEELDVGGLRGRAVVPHASHVVPAPPVPQEGQHVLQDRVPQVLPGLGLR
eukprot:349393-Alexandrium_andersonii.AAC.1